MFYLVFTILLIALVIFMQVTGIRFKDKGTYSYGGEGTHGDDSGSGGSDGGGGGD